MDKCDVCGRELARKYCLQGHILCSKHMHQLYNYGKFLDNIPRTTSDLNGFRVEDEIAIFDLYSTPSSEKIGEFIIDLEDLEKVRYHKWRFHSDGHVITGLPAQGTQRDISWVVLDMDNRQKEYKDKVVDHINGNPRDNRKANLRVCSQGENVRNKSFMSNNTSGFIGVSYREDRDRYDPEIRLQGQRCHLGYTKTKEEAVYKRYYAEKLVFKEFANSTEQQKKEEFTKNLSAEQKYTLEKIVEEKLQAKGLWQ